MTANFSRPSSSGTVCRAMRSSTRSRPAVSCKQVRVPEGAFIGGAPERVTRTLKCGAKRSQRRGTAGTAARRHNQKLVGAALGSAA